MSSSNHLRSECGPLIEVPTKAIGVKDFFLGDRLPQAQLVESFLFV